VLYYLEVGAAEQHDRREEEHTGNGTDRDKGPVSQ
jgi:hypothetical protein